MRHANPRAVSVTLPSSPLADIRLTVVQILSESDESHTPEVICYAI